MTKANLKLSDFDYNLSRELIAQYPCAERSQSRLLVLERGKKRISHRSFSDIVDYFSPGDCLVLNDTRVIPARIFGRRERLNLHPRDAVGGKQEILLLENLSKDTYRVLANPARKLTEGRKILFNNGALSALVLADEGRHKIVRFNGNGDIKNLWPKIGEVPLPPYIKRKPEAMDKERYQTVFARKEGACAAPTAGLHFTKDLLRRLKDKGINIAYLTLHVSYGTFAPVKEEDITKHKMYREYFILPEKAKKIICAARAKGKRIIACGTTSLRVLETCTVGKVDPLISARSGWTDLFIYPPYQFRAVDCLLTNFHFPKSTLLMLVSAFAGRKLIFRAYREAIKRRYRFFSYGDAMLIL